MNATEKRTVSVREGAMIKALREIANVADAAIFFEGNNRIYKTIRRMARTAATKATK